MKLIQSSASYQKCSLTSSLTLFRGNTNILYTLHTLCVYTCLHSNESTIIRFRAFHPGFFQGACAVSAKIFVVTNFLTAVDFAQINIQTNICPKVCHAKSFSSRLLSNRLASDIY